jgi:hypothetical protein
MKRLRPRTACVLMHDGFTATTTTSTSAWWFSSSQPLLMVALKASICCDNVRRPNHGRQVAVLLLARPVCASHTPLGPPGRTLELMSHWMSECEAKISSRYITVAINVKSSTAHIRRPGAVALEASQAILFEMPRTRCMVSRRGRPAVVLRIHAQALN